MLPFRAVSTRAFGVTVFLIMRLLAQRTDDRRIEVTRARREKVVPRKLRKWREKTNFPRYCDWQYSWHRDKLRRVGGL